MGTKKLAQVPTDSKCNGAELDTRSDQTPQTLLYFWLH